MGSPRFSLIIAPEGEAIDEPQNELPETVALQQNYPNPFNPSTTIAYSVPEPSTVTLEVFDMLGQKVATLVNGTKSPGQYEVPFNAQHLASGLYMYHLRVDETVLTKKMMLVK